MDSVGPEEGSRIMNTIASGWLREGWQEGVREGRQEGLQQGLQQGQQAGYANIILLQARLRFARLSPPTEKQIQALSLAQLEQLAVALLNFKTSKDLTAWLRTHAKAQ